MNISKKLLGVIATLAIGIGVIGSANATCSVYGKVVYSYNSGAGSIYYYLAPTTAFPTYYYGFSASNQDMKDQMNNAMANDETVMVYGNATSCPTTGTYRFIGSPLRSYVYENL
jgi:hypothetical protein